MAGELRKAHNLTDTVDQIAEGLMATGRYINKSKLNHLSGLYTISLSLDITLLHLTLNLQSM